MKIKKDNSVFLLLPETNEKQEALEKLFSTSCSFKVIEAGFVQAIHSHPSGQTLSRVFSE